MTTALIEQSMQTKAVSKGVYIPLVFSSEKKSPSRLAILHKALEIATAAIRLKQMLLKDQLRNAVVKAVHVRQYEETEKELAEAVAELIKKQYARAAKTITEKGEAKFDPRDWDDELIDTCLPILMRKAGEAAAAQMLIMGVDVAPRRRRGRTEKGDLPGHPFRGNQWSGGQGSGRPEIEKWATEKFGSEKAGKEFASWFGNSKVVDESGNPLLVYHAVQSGDMFDQFESSHTRSGSEEYWFDADYGRYAELAAVGSLAVYLKIENPAKGRGGKTNEELKSAGYDGIIDIDKDFDTGAVMSRTYIALDPAQIRIDKVERRKSPSFISTKTSATDWLLDNADEEDLRFLWPEVFTLPSGTVIDMGFATEWPPWMKAEIFKQMKECFEQPFWAGINDTTAQGIEAHVQRGLDEGLSIREIRDQMVGDGLNEYYHNRGINIARTESGNALNGARSSAMDRLTEEVPGLRVKRTWMSVLGTTTRRTHANLDGVPADRDGMWYLGGVRIPWPGHWNLPVQERACCQCTIVQSWGMSDESASELIDEYNERLNEERSLRDRLIEKGDLPGHPFRGNQWEGGQGGGNALSGLSRQERDALEDYSMDKFQSINSALRSGKLGGENVRIVSKIDSALQKAPKRAGSTVRSFQLPDGEEGNRIRSMLKDGGTFEDAAYVSTRKQPSLSDRAGFMDKKAPPNRVIMRINGRSGVDISELSKNPAEGEVLFPRGTKFRVDKAVHLENGAILAILSEAGEKSVKGDLPGHPFRGNQWEGGGRFADMSPGDEKSWIGPDGQRQLPKLSSYDIVPSPLRRPPEGEPSILEIRSNKYLMDAPVDSAPVRDVRVDDLYAWQAVIDVRGVGLQPWTGTESPIGVVKWKDRLYVMEGNHRAAVAWASNVEMIQAKFVDLDDPKNQKYIKPKYRVGKSVKGDLPGHPFRGNQWSGGQGGPVSDADKRRMARVVEAKSHVSLTIMRDNQGVPMQVRDDVAAAAHSVIERMGAGAAARMKDLQHVMIFEDEKHLSEVLSSHFPDKAKELEGGSLTAASYMEGASSVFVGHADKVKLVGVMSHELMHAVDGEFKEISGSKEWQDAWKAEVRDVSKLTNYGQKSPSEGLAEFGRMLWSTSIPIDKIEKSFPRMTAILRRERVIA